MLDKWDIQYCDPTPPSGRAKIYTGYIHKKNLFDGIDPIILKAIKDTLVDFRSHAYLSGSRLKLLMGTPLKTLRINSSDRLAITSIKIQGFTFALIHDAMLEHDFRKYSVLFDASVLAATEAACQSDLSSLVISTLATQTKEEQEPDIPVETKYDDAFIEFTPTEYRLIQGVYPSMANGAPGVGKTLVAIKKMEYALNNADPNRPLIGLIITGSAKLADEINEELKKNRTPSVHKVGAVTYRVWIEQYANGREIVGDDDFKAWYENYVVEQNKRYKTTLSQKKKRTETTQLSKCFPFSKEDFEAVKCTIKAFAGRKIDEISERDLVFPLEQKALLWQLYLDYRTNLESSNKLHPAFYAIPEGLKDSILFDIAHIDEGQNFTYVQLDNLFKKAKKRDENPLIHISYDSHQVLNTYVSNRKKIMDTLKPFSDTLIGNHRSKSEIISFLNLFIRSVKYIVTQGLGDEFEDSTFIPGSLLDTRLIESPVQSSSKTSSPGMVSELLSDTSSLEVESQGKTPSPVMAPEPSIVHTEDSEPKGEICWPDTLAELYADRSNYNFQSGRWLIVTHPEFYDEAVELFGNAYTFADIIGLEDENVYLHRPFDHKAFIEIDKILADNARETFTPIHQAKKGSGTIKYNPILNGIISGGFRAKTLLLIGQDKNKPALRHLMDRLKANTYSRQGKNVNKNEITQAAWKQKIKYAILEGKLVEAERDFDRYLKSKLRITFDAFKSSVLAASLPSIAAPKSPLSAQKSQDEARQALRLRTHFTKDELQKYFETGLLLQLLCTNVATKGKKITLLEEVMSNQSKKNTFEQWLKQIDSIESFLQSLADKGFAVGCLSEPLGLNTTRAAMPEPEKKSEAPISTTHENRVKRPQNSKVTLYLTNLFAQFNAANLKKFIDFYKAEKAIYYLGYLIEDSTHHKTPLLSAILFDNEKRKIFCNYLQENETFFEQLHRDYIDEDNNHLEHLAVLSCSYELLEWMVDRSWSVIRDNKDHVKAPYYAVQQSDVLAINIFSKKINPFQQLFEVDFVKKARKRVFPFLLPVDYGSMESSFKNRTTPTRWYPLIDLKGTTPVHLAVQHDDAKMTKNVLNVHTHWVNSVIESSRVAPIHIAAQHGSLELLEVLLKNDAEVDLPMASGHTALFVAAQFGRTDLVMALLKRGANIDLEVHGVTPVMHALYYGQDEVVSQLIYNGAKLDNFKVRTQRDCIDLERCLTAEHKALRMRRKHLILLVSKFDRNRFQYFCESIIQEHDPSLSLLSEFSIFYQVIWTVPERACLIDLMLRNEEHVRILCDMLPSPYTHNSPTSTLCLKHLMDLSRDVRHGCLMHYATEANARNFIYFLHKDLHMSLNDNNCQGFPPLTIAIDANNPSLMKFLVDLGANINARMGEAFTLLTFAITIGSVEVVQFLLEEGVSLDKLPDHGKSPREVAEAEGNLAIVAMIDEAIRKREALSGANQEKIEAHAQCTTVTVTQLPFFRHNTPPLDKDNNMPNECVKSTSHFGI